MSTACGVTNIYAPKARP